MTSDVIYMYIKISTTYKQTSFCLAFFPGDIFTRERLDREMQSSKNLFITVKVQDQGTNPLDDYCTFPVTIQDINDNAPDFGSTEFRGRILQSAASGTKVLTVKATDKDLGANANIKYSLSSNPNNLFRINADTGEIESSSPLPSDVSCTTIPHLLNGLSKIPLLIYTVCNYA